MSQPETPRLKKNNFDLLRLIFAATVCFVHADELSGYAKIGWISQVLSSEVAVKAFFVVSGFLIFMSYERSSSLATYFIKRVRRIYPAYVTVILLAAFGLVLVSRLDYRDYFAVDWFKYLAANLAFLNFLQPTLPGVFESNRFTAVNGALWTLKVEVLFYLSVPIFGWFFKKLSRTWVLLGGYVLSLVYVWICNLLAIRTGNAMYAELGRQLPGQLSYFLGGAFLYYHLPFFEKYAAYFLGGGVVVLVVNIFQPLMFLEPFALAVVVVFFGLFFYMGEFSENGDFSYGVYILHFPILQIFIQYGWLRDMPWLYLSVALSVTLAAAFLLWHGVEKRFLFKGSHYISKQTSS